MQVCLHMYVYIVLSRLLHRYVVCVGMFEGGEENPAQLSFLLKPQEEVAQIMKDVTAETMEAYNRLLISNDYPKSRFGLMMVISYTNGVY